MSHTPHRLDQTHAAELSDVLLGVDGVDSLHSGRYGQIALLFPGARYPGLTQRTNDNDDQRLEIHIVVTKDALSDLEGVAQRCREIASTYVSGAIDVTIADVAA
ncbi:hypothetical protein CCICO_01385 [Corynebacterium ciconiae DSM 44920]|uniref:hypothetical protein n=1 Tax=Corynebacterium ciconiae TaxID=227319 RepID=UPI00036C4B18|nr:hypothetical protein [Corynebacterium ciconiae]WKD60331.1 hypothetical protein CCICO_01385 [Corynebacterium ciconiae DSM 44920]